MRILVVFTGGTIGSVKQDQIIRTDSAARYLLLDLFRRARPDLDVELEVIAPLDLLSENLIPADWVHLATALEAANPAAYDGVIITHGTDTLAYTGAALSFGLGNAGVPVVLVGAHYPLGDPRSEGVRNFIGAVEFISRARIPGVFVAFEDAAGRLKIHLGCRIMSAQPFTDAFNSAADCHFGEMADGFHWHDHPLNVAPARLAAAPPATPPEEYATDVLYLRPLPGLDYRYFRFGAEKPRAVLHDLNHSATACTRTPEISHSILPFLAACRDNGIDVFLAPVKHTGGDMYETACQMRDAGAVALENMTVEAAWVKILQAYGKVASREERLRRMVADWSFERLGS